MKTLRRVLGFLVVATSSLWAGGVSFTGVFESDDQVQLINLNLSSTQSVTFETLSYGGGTNSAGTTIPAGGFDPRLTWFHADGTEIGRDNGGHCLYTNSYLGACNDAYFNGILSAGSYVLALTEDGNDPNGDLIDGFSEAGNGDFTASGACTEFCDSLSGAQLTGNWAVDILTSQESATPKPGTVALTLIGFSLLALAGHKHSV